MVFCLPAYQPHDRLPICPGCTLPLALMTAGIDPSFPGVKKMDVWIYFYEIHLADVVNNAALSAFSFGPFLVI